MRFRAHFAAVFCAVALASSVGCFKTESEPAPVAEVASRLSRPWNGFIQMSLDGVDVGVIQKAGGGSIDGDVTDLPHSHDFVVKKQIGNVKYEDFNVQIGLSMGQPIRDWITASLDSEPVYKNGELSVGHFKVDVREIREMRGAYLNAIGFPATDAHATEPAFVTIDWSAGTVIVRAEPWSRPDASTSERVPGLSPSRVRMAVAGGELADVIATSPINISFGEVRRISDLSVTLSEAAAADLADRLHDVTSRTGVVEYFAEDNQAVAYRLELTNLALIDVQTPSDQTSSRIAKISVGAARLAL